MSDHQTLYLGDFVYQMRTSHTRQEAFLTVVYCHHCLEHPLWGRWLEENFGQPMGDPKETSILFESFSRKRYKSTMPKTPRYGQRKKIRAEGVAMRVRHGMRMSRNQMRVFQRLCPSLQCTSGELLKAEKKVLP